MTPEPESLTEGTPHVVRGARSDELDTIDALLRDAGLHPLESHPMLPNLFVVLEAGDVVGAVVLEVFARSGLIRSMAVQESRRQAGLGRELMTTLRARAYELGLRELFASTEAAADFFRSLGFRDVANERAPLAIRSRAASTDGASGSPGLLRLEL